MSISYSENYLEIMPQLASMRGAKHYDKAERVYDMIEASIREKDLSFEMRPASFIYVKDFLIKTLLPYNLYHQGNGQWFFRNREYKRIGWPMNTCDNYDGVEQYCFSLNTEQLEQIIELIAACGIKTYVSPHELRADHNLWLCPYGSVLSSSQNGAKHKRDKCCYREMLRQLFEIIFPDKDFSTFDKVLRELLFPYKNW